MLRPYQAKLKSEIYAAWAAGTRTVMGVMPTGAGKTKTFTDIMSENKGASIAIAHRAELVSQMSLALARNKIHHRVIGQTALSRTCSSIHLAELQRNYINPNARCAAASVQTLIRRDANESFFKEVTLVVIDEGHHLLEGNAWGTAAKLFPNAKILTVTATPGRTDGKGLGVHADGLVEVMVTGPSMRELIDQGYLTDYRLICPPSDIDLSNVPVSASGDYSPPKLAAAVHKSHVVGDVVANYLKFAAGKLGVTFAVDLASAGEIAQAYRTAGVTAEVISGDTPDLLRVNLMRRFRNKEILQLVNCDLLGEGVDVPAIEVVSMARPTQSVILYHQQFGRALRPMDGKGKAIIIDHVSNWMRHGLPDAPRVWSLDRRERRLRSAPDDVVPLRVCTQCLSAYERIYVSCPYCGTTPVPASRSTPDAVDGDLAEMSPELLARLRGEIDQGPKIPYGAAPIVVASVHKHHREKVEAQRSLRDTMALWGGWRVAQNDSIAEQQRRFFHQFGMDALSAQALNRAEASALEAKIRGILESAGIKGVDALVSNG